MYREQLDQFLSRHKRCYEVKVELSYGLIRSVPQYYKHVDKHTATAILKQAMSFDFVKEVTVKARKCLDGQWQTFTKVFPQSQEKVDAYQRRWLRKSKSDQQALLDDYNRLNRIRALQALPPKVEYFVRKQISKRQQSQIEASLEGKPGATVQDDFWIYFMKDGKLKRRRSY